MRKGGLPLCPWHFSLWAKGPSGFGCLHHLVLVAEVELCEVAVGAVLLEPDGAHECLVEDERVAVERDERGGALAA